MLLIDTPPREIVRDARQREERGRGRYATLSKRLAEQVREVGSYVYMAPLNVVSNGMSTCMGLTYT
jgi:hypothetical protein